jgi:ubiquinol-cytochrome c reductase iron-sulfur subunit
MNGTHVMPDRAQFFTTPARPGNFGDHIDFKAVIDNWFE